MEFGREVDALRATAAAMSTILPPRPLSRAGGSSRRPPRTTTLRTCHPRPGRRRRPRRALPPRRRSCGRARVTASVPGQPPDPGARFWCRARNAAGGRTLRLQEPNEPAHACEPVRSRPDRSRGRGHRVTVRCHRAPARRGGDSHLPRGVPRGSRRRRRVHRRCAGRHRPPARGMSEVAGGAGLSRESLQRALSGERDPTPDTVPGVASAPGLKPRADTAVDAAVAGSAASDPPGRSGRSRRRVGTIVSQTLPASPYQMDTEPFTDNRRAMFADSCSLKCAHVGTPGAVIQRLPEPRLIGPLVALSGQSGPSSGRRGRRPPERLIHEVRGELPPGRMPTAAPLGFQPASSSAYSHQSRASHRPTHFDGSYGVGSNRE